MGKMHLSYKQWLDLLYKIKKVVSKRGFKAKGEDSTSTGNKYTTSNCGLCNDNFSTKETALWPEHFEEGRITLKYLEEYQKCPFDWREKIFQRSHRLFLHLLYF